MFGLKLTMIVIPAFILFQLLAFVDLYSPQVLAQGYNDNVSWRPTQQTNNEQHTKTTTPPPFDALKWIAIYEDSIEKKLPASVQNGKISETLLATLDTITDQGQNVNRVKLNPQAQNTENPSTDLRYKKPKQASRSGENSMPNTSLITPGAVVNAAKIGSIAELINKPSTWPAKHPDGHGIRPVVIKHRRRRRQSQDRADRMTMSKTDNYPTSMTMGNAAVELSSTTTAIHSVNESDPAHTTWPSTNHVRPTTSSAGNSQAMYEDTTLACANKSNSGEGASRIIRSKETMALSTTNVSQIPKPGEAKMLITENSNNVLPTDPIPQKDPRETITTTKMTPVSSNTPRMQMTIMGLATSLKPTTLGTTTRPISEKETTSTPTRIGTIASNQASDATLMTIKPFTTRMLKTRPARISKISRITTQSIDILIKGTVAPSEHTTTSTIDPLILTTLESLKTRPRTVEDNQLGFPWPVKKEAVVEGDIVLGGLMMVHEREDSITCGPVMPQGGIQALEAMLYTLDQLNNPLQGQFLPNITLGAHILDDCDKDTYGLEMAVDFIKAKHKPLHHRGSFAYREEFLEERPHIELEESGDDAAGSSIKHHIRHHHEVTPWPVKKEAVVEGDIVLGGLMMVHEREDSITCGPVMPQGGIQALEAMLYTLDRLNHGDSTGTLLPEIKLGAHILDDCDKDTYGLEMAVDFIKGSISNIDGAEYSCNKSQVRKVISGVVGAASSVTSIQVANLLRLFKIPQVSFFSTSPELSNKQRFEYFTRTIPSDHYQVKAMVDIVKLLGWSYVSIIYEESNYGIKAFEELEDLLAEYNICIAIKEKLVKDSGVADESAYDSIVQKLLTKPRARGAIIFGSDQEVAGVMRAVRRNNATGSFSWIGSDGWSARSLVSDGNEAEVEGTLSVQPQANPVQGFEEYFLNLNVENNKRNPWFIEFWEHHFQCVYPNSSRTPYNQKYNNVCTGREQLTKQNTVFEDQLQFVSDAVMAFAYAIRDMHLELCKGRPGLCDAMKPTKGTELLKYLRKVNFEGLSGDRFHFDQNGDGPARYNIIHFKQTTAGKYKWIRVGEYHEGELRLNMQEIQFKLAHPKPPESVCSLPCDLGQAKKYVEGESCCWHCFNCTQYQIRDPLDETQCKECLPGTVPDVLHVRCVDIPEEYLQPDSAWAIGAMAFSSTGILVTMFVCGVFMRHNDTPVVRASGRELSYVLLAGIFMCYAVTYALVFRPSDVVCGIQRFGAGFCFTVVYAALLTKTNRISRIFNAGKRSAKRPSFISPRSQLIICSGLVGVQVLINAVWMVISPPKAIHHYPTREDNLLVCSSYIDASYMIAFTYPILLIVICTVYAVLTRKIPEAFNESKHIGFTMYTTCVIWLAFVPLYFGTANHVAMRITSMSVTISLSASVTVVCLFSPKLYIILIRPERNVRQSMMPMRYSAINKSATATTNSGAGSMMAAVTLTAATCNQKNQIQKHVPPGNSEEKDGDSSSKPELKDSSTQTNGYIAPPPAAVPASNGVSTASTDEHARVNNNYNNGPILPMKADL